jgi:Domain of unknown function (DUF5919)
VRWAVVLVSFSWPSETARWISSVRSRTSSHWIARASCGRSPASARTESSVASRALADAGCRIRIAIGDPDGACVAARGEEERFGLGITSRCELALMHYRPLIGHPRISIHLHDTTLYSSIYRFDDEALINTHVWGANAFAAPVLHIRRLSSGRLFSAYLQSFEAVWEGSTPAAA